MNKTSILNILYQVVKSKFPRDIQRNIILKEIETVEDSKFIFFLYYYIDEFNGDLSCQLVCVKTDENMKGLLGFEAYAPRHYSFVDKEEFLKKCKNTNCLINLFSKEKYDHDKEEIYYMYGL